MRRARYMVAMSLDGYIAGPNGEADWIIMDPDIDFPEHSSSSSTRFLWDAERSRPSEEQGAAGSRECRRSSSRGRCAKRTIRTSP
jgi:hypothetical protein